MNAMVRPLAIRSPRTALAALVLAALAAACASATPSPTATPTATPPYGLPPLELPADEAPHDFGTEWWYFNVHLWDEDGRRYALHDVVFQVQDLDSSRTLYVRQAGFADVSAGTHATAERLRSEPEPLSEEAGVFRAAFGDLFVSAEGGRRYRLVGEVGTSAYDLTLLATGAPLLHHDDGLVDFGEAGVTYYYSRPRLEVSGTVTAAGGSAVPVTGLGWMDRQWGNFQPVAIGWDWASVQLDDGTDLMLTRVFDADGTTVESYATLRRGSGPARLLGAGDFEFAPAGPTWTSARTGTSYATSWRVAVPGEVAAFTLEPLVAGNEFVSGALGVVYWEAGAEARAADGRVVGQGFIELNWPRGAMP